MNGEMDGDLRSIFSRAAPLLPPPHVTLDLLSSGVCMRCIFRLFGVHGDVYSCPLPTGPMLHCFLKVQNGSHGGISENGSSSITFHHSSYNFEKLDVDQEYCSICLGILLFSPDQHQGERKSKDVCSIGAFVEKIAESVKSGNHQIDGFLLEVSIPPVIIANERSIRLYMKKKYDSEAWFKDFDHRKQIALKDALRLALTESLERQLNVKSGANSFHIYLIYSHLATSSRLQKFLGKAQNFKRKRNAYKVNVASTVDQLSSGGHVDFKSDAAIMKDLNSLDDLTFCKHFELPPEKVSDSCQLMITCYRIPMFIGGRYLKLSRKVSQTRWIIDDERMGEASVEEIIGAHALEICRGDTYKFHAAGREDIDVRMLGSGRPFLVEVSNARCLLSIVDVLQIAAKINSSEKKYVEVRNLKVVGSEVWNLMREGEAEKQKQYAALVWISRPLVDEDLQIISSVNNLEISQRTPIRVLHRRSSLERKRIIHWMKSEKIIGSNQFFFLYLCTQAGTYIKEFVHGDLGRTVPSIGSMFGCRAEILQLDVTDVKMDAFI